MVEAGTHRSTRRSGLLIPSAEIKRETASDTSNWCGIKVICKRLPSYQRFFTSITTKLLIVTVHYALFMRLDIFTA